MSWKTNENRWELKLLSAFVLAVLVLKLAADFYEGIAFMERYADIGFYGGIGLLFLVACSEFKSWWKKVVVACCGLFLMAYPFLPQEQPYNFIALGGIALPLILALFESEKNTQQREEPPQKS